MSRFRRRAAIVGVSAVVMGSLGAVAAPANAARCEASAAHQLLCFVRDRVNKVTCEYDIPNPTHQCPE